MFFIVLNISIATSSAIIVINKFTSTTAITVAGANYVSIAFELTSTITMIIADMFKSIFEVLPPLLSPVIIAIIAGTGTVIFISLILSTSPTIMIVDINTLGTAVNSRVLFGTF